MLLIDAHVHIHECFNLVDFFKHAFQNFNAVAAKIQPQKTLTGILMLTESQNKNIFSTLASFSNDKLFYPRLNSINFDVSHTDEKISLKIQDEKKNKIIIIAGRQIVTKERLEVLALCFENIIKDGRPIMDVIKEVREFGGLPVLPWGFGKWTGRRGKILDRILENSERPKIFLGDNGGRAGFLPEPRQFRLAAERGIRILPGSDPLPFPAEIERAGSFGCKVCVDLSENRPAKYLKEILADSRFVLEPYGCLEDPFRFFHNQIKMQFWKRR
jgi:hypothetical protein